MKAELLIELAPAQLKVRNVSKIFRTKKGEVHALKDISLDIREGEFVCLVGPSGCGKTTLLNIIAGLDKPSKGTVTVEGMYIAAPGSDRMMMFQESALFPWLTVFQNVLFSLKLKPGLTNKDRKEVALFYLSLVHLEKFKDAYIHELSSGMRQRVALARCLAPNPRILLMDEPFGALDALTREFLYRDIQDIWMKRKKTIIFVTHNVREGCCLGDRVILFSSHPGTIREQFEIKLSRPRDINTVELAQYSSRITRVLKNYADDQKEIFE